MRTQADRLSGARGLPNQGRRNGLGGPGLEGVRSAGVHAVSGEGIGGVLRRRRAAGVGEMNGAGMAGRLREPPEGGIFR